MIKKCFYDQNLLPLLWTLAATTVLSACAAGTMQMAKVHDTGGSDAGNGGGIAEKRMVFAYQNLGKYLDLCLQTPYCRLSESELALSRKIRKDLPDEYRAAPNLEFSAGKDRPQFFVLEGQVRVAKTGDSVGSPIYVNTDLLYWRDTAGRSGSVDLPTAVSILIHELGHHEGIRDHNELDRMGSKFQSFLLKQITQSSIWNGDVQFTVVQNNAVFHDEDKKRLHEIDQLLMGYGSNLVDLTDQIVAHLRCPHASTSVKGLRLYNFHEDRGLVYDKSEDVTQKPLRLWYVLSCRDGEESDHGDIDIHLALRRDLRDGSVSFISEKSSYRQDSCLEQPEFCK